jgi:hypothetical protein
LVENSTGLLKNGPFEKEKEKKDISKLNTVVPVSFPNIAFGNSANTTKLLFKNATVWTNEKKESLQKLMY